MKIDIDKKDNQIYIKVGEEDLWIGTLFDVHIEKTNNSNVLYVRIKHSQSGDSSLGVLAEILDYTKPKIEHIGIVSDWHAWEFTITKEELKQQLPFMFKWLLQQFYEDIAEYPELSVDNIQKLIDNF